MTFVAVALLGVAIVLIGSALDNSSVAQTVQKIIANKPLDWTGTGATPPPKSTATAGGGIA